jgi:FAD/FMN-containing dehydrogenase/Fe-S oxidoreductase
MLLTHLSIFVPAKRKNKVNMQKIQKALIEIKDTFSGEIYVDETTRILYSTDASAYQEAPVAVIIPENTEDIKLAVSFAKKHKTSVIPRAAGTSLAGQVVGPGIVLDISKYMNRIIELNKEEKWVRIEPGVNLDELNMYLKPHGLFFAPETSTSNRCRIGGMVGNNSCGSHSVIYGSTREHTLEIEAVLSDGSEVTFKPLTKKELEEKCSLNTLEGEIYQHLHRLLSEPANQSEIKKEFPDPANPRRNTGYALDVMLESEPFNPKGEPFNMCQLISGSEGTLCFITGIKLNLVDLPPQNTALICAHFNSLDDALRANIIALKYKPGAVELMDDIVMNCTKDSIQYQKYRFFIQGDPKAMLMIEFARDTMEEIRQIAAEMEKEMKSAGYGYHFPVITGDDIPKVWALRKAGLGLLSNVPGDKKSTTVIEDTSVKVEVLPDYVSDFQKILKKYHITTCVFYAHVGSGELHLRPMMNLKEQEEVDLFYNLGLEVAKLVKTYRGSLSGEHGDGRLRGEFIPLMIGDKNYQLLKEIKKAWDPDNIFNPGKITDTPPMTSGLRYQVGKGTRDIDTVFDFSSEKGVVRASERCTGSGDCRKSEIIGGTMCPSFMATRNEKDSTRARANILRQFLTHSPKQNPFDHKEIYEVMELCLSCKACKSECPSGVDVAKLKAEFLQHYYDAHGIPLRTRLIAYITRINKLGSTFPGIMNFFMGNKTVSGIIKRTIGFAPERSMPLLYKTTLTKWFTKQKLNGKTDRTIFLFNDEFTNFNDTEIGIKTILLLTKLGYDVKIPKHKESGRTFLSKGMLRSAKHIAISNILLLKDIITQETPLIGIEPSAILAFRDEYPELAGTKLKEDAEKLAQNALTIEEFLAREIQAGNLKKDLFTKEYKTIKLHGHCQQKAIASTSPTMTILSFPENYKVSEIPSGCCGMAGSFGYEKEHYDVSMKVGELVLFPEVRKTDQDVIIAAPGTSCRHQIKDGTGRTAKHPVEVLYEALVK